MPPWTSRQPKRIAVSISWLIENCLALSYHVHVEVIYTGVHCFAELGGTPTFDDCDVCFASLLGNIFLPIFPELGFSYDEIPADPSMIAQELQGGDFGGCQDKLQELFSENSFGAAEIGGLVSCPMDQGWGDLTIEEFREYNPDFLKDAPPTGEGM